MTTRTPPESADARVRRLLTMVPWLVAHDGIAMDEAARELDITQAQLADDLDLLLMCGYGPMYGELIEIEYENGHIHLSNAETIEKPLRLRRDEALSLILGLRSLPALTTPAGDDVVKRALAKLEAATDAEAKEAQQALDVVEDEPDDAPALPQVREALERGRRLHLRYLVPARDEATERDVDPIRLLRSDGWWYLEGWCHRAQDIRLFRLDRVLDITVLEEEATPPPRAATTTGRGTFEGSSYPVATLELDPQAAWVAEYYPTEAVRVRADGCTEVDLRVSGQAWLTRLLLRLGGHGRVIAPPELVGPVAEAARSALGAYDTPAT